METRATFTISELGKDPGNLERVLDAFLHIAAYTGPVVEANTATGVLLVTFTVDADSWDGTKEALTRVFVDSMNESGVRKTELLDVELVDVGAAAELQRELEYA